MWKHVLEIRFTEVRKNIAMKTWKMINDLNKANPDKPEINILYREIQQLYCDKKGTSTPHLDTLLEFHRTVLNKIVSVCATWPGMGVPGWSDLNGGHKTQKEFHQNI